jgi:hypothetical protein
MTATTAISVTDYLSSGEPAIGIRPTFYKLIWWINQNLSVLINEPWWNNLLNAFIDYERLVELPGSFFGCLLRHNDCANSYRLVVSVVLN